MSSNNQSSRIALKAITPAHLILSVIVSAVITAGTALMQYFQLNAGHLSIVGLIGAALVSFFSAMGTGIISLENNPTVQQSIDGALAQHTNALGQLIAQHSDVINQVLNVLHILTNQASVQKAPAPQVQSQPVPPMPLQAPAPAPFQQVQQVPFPPLPQFTAPQAAISSSQAQQPGQPQ